MAVFDAPSREICAIRRVRTNTPLQSLVTLNDPVYVEAAQALARRIVREGGSRRFDRASAMACSSACAGRRGPNRSSRWSPSTPAELRRVTARTATAARALATDPLGPLPPAWNRPIWPPGRPSPTYS